MTGKLVICPTPLGNLGDMTARAVAALREADVVCCEDTRVTGRLLAALGIEGVRLERLDEAVLRLPSNRVSAAGGPLPGDDEATVADATALRMLEGERIVYCSDAGMPGVSDPGAVLVEAARSAGVPVEVLPGPSAAVTAYVACGFTCPRWYFGGFFPRKAGERRRLLQGLAALDAVLVFYESPKRIAGALAAVAEVLPGRRAAVCRELTKVHEEVVVDAAGALAAEFARREEAGGVRGEVVLVVDAPDEEDAAQEAQRAHGAAAERAAELLAEGALPRKQIARVLQDEFGIPRNDAYSLAVSASRIP